MSLDKHEKLDDIPRPSGVVINVSDVCNIHCTYCFEAKDEAQVTDSDSYPFVLESILSMSEKSSSPQFVVSFYGGEPLMHMNVIEQIVADLLAQAPSSRFKFTVATNGILVRGAREDFLREHDFHIQISLDGNKSVVDTHRVDFTGKGTFDRLKHLVDRVRSFPDIMARATVTPDTVQELSNSIQFLIDVGFDAPNRKLKWDYDLTSSWEVSHFSHLSDQTGEVAEVLINHYRNEGEAYVEPLNRVFSQERPLESKCGRGGYCGAGCSMVHVNSKAEWYSCNRLTPSHSKDHESLKLSEPGRYEPSTKHQAVMLQIHPGIDRKPECETCRARHYCEQTCPARIHAGSGQFNKISDKQCALIRATHSIGRKVLANHILHPFPKFQAVYSL